MEENNKTTEVTMSKENTEYEKLMETAKMLQQRAMIAEQKLMAINLTTMRLNYLFTTLDHASYFPKEFVDNVSKEIIELLTLKEEEDKETKE